MQIFLEWSLLPEYGPLVTGCLLCPLPRVSR